MAYIPLTQGKVALVDDADYERLAAFKWYALRSGRRWYAVRMTSRTLGPQRPIYMHHEIFGKPPPGLETDHVNGDGCDNRRVNVRFVTRTQNQGNARPQLGRTSRFKGVCWEKHKRRWRAQARLGGKNRLLGYFTNEEDAARAYDAAAVAKWGEFARPNFSRKG